MYATLLLPDISVATVSSMLKCTLNPAVRNDTLSVNELQVMKLLGFSVCLPTYQNECEAKSDPERSEIELNLADCLHDGYISGDLDVSVDPIDGTHAEDSMLGNEDGEDDDNLDNISLLSSTLSIGDVSRAIGLKHPDIIPDRKVDICENHTKSSIENNTSILPPPPEQISKEPIPETSIVNIDLQEKQLYHAVKSTVDRYFDRESVINTPTLPTLTGDENDELGNMSSDFPLQTKGLILTKKPDTNIAPERMLQSVDVLSNDQFSTTTSNKNLLSDDQIELESSSSEYEKRGWTICEEPSSCDIRNSQPEIIKACKSLIPPKAKSFVCPSPNCKLKFQRLLHYERHVGSCLAKSAAAGGKSAQQGDFECVECGKLFHHPDNLKLHEKYHADLLIQKECNICGASGIMGRHALTAHMEKCHSTKIPCPICKKVLSSRRLLNRHISRIHQKKSGD